MVMMISGTRGAMIVPLIGGFVYLILRKNIRVIVFGTILLIGGLCFLQIYLYWSGGYRRQANAYSISTRR